MRLILQPSGGEVKNRMPQHRRKVFPVYLAIKAVRGAQLRVAHNQTVELTLLVAAGAFLISDVPENR